MSHYQLLIEAVRVAPLTRDGAFDFLKTNGDNNPSRTIGYAKNRGVIAENDGVLSLGNGNPVKRKYTKRVKPEPVAEVEPVPFDCAVWSGGDCTIVGAAVNEHGHVSLSAEQAILLRKTLSRAMPPKRFDEVVLPEPQI